VRVFTADAAALGLGGELGVRYSLASSKEKEAKTRKIRGAEEKEAKTRKIRGAEEKEAKTRKIRGAEEKEAKTRKIRGAETFMRTPDLGREHFGPWS